MADTPSKIFDRPLSNLSGKNTDERTLKAIELVKSTRPDLWDRFLKFEQEGDNLDYVAGQLHVLLTKAMKVTNTLELIDLRMEIRKQVRREAGLEY